MNPVFIYVMANGDVWAGGDSTVAEPAGTLAARFRISSLSHLIKLGTVSGTSPNFSCSNGVTNKFDASKEKN